MKRFWQGIGLLAILSYLLIGGVLILGTGFDQVVPDDYRKPLGGILILYGIYRIVRKYSPHKVDRDET